MINYKRGKGKVTTDFGMGEMYDFYLDNYKNTVTKALYREICKEFNEKALQEVIYEAHDFSMGSRLGSIRVRKFNNTPRLNKEGELSNNFGVNWYETKKLWKEKWPDKSDEEIRNIPNKPRILHLNKHTDGWVMKWHWDKITCNVPNQSAYRFEPQRTIKREAAKAWKNNPSMYTIYYE